MLVTLLFFTLENTVLLALVWMDNHYEASDINLVSRLMQVRPYIPLSSRHKL